MQILKQTLVHKSDKNYKVPKSAKAYEIYRKLWRSKKLESNTSHFGLKARYKLKTVDD